MTLPVRELLTQCVNDNGPGDYVFTREDGKPVRDFRGAWVKACDAAKGTRPSVSRPAPDSSTEPASPWSCRRGHYEDRGWKTSERVRTLGDRFAIRYPRRDGETRGGAAAGLRRSGSRTEFIRRTVWSEFGQNRTQER